METVKIRKCTLRLFYQQVLRIVVLIFESFKTIGSDMLVVFSVFIPEVSTYVSLFVRSLIVLGLPSPRLPCSSPGLWSLVSVG